MSKKTKTSSTTVQTPVNPQWVTDSLQGLSGQIGGLATKDPLSYVAPANALQLQAASNASKLGGNQAGYTQAQDYLSKALNADTPQMTAAQSAGVTLGPAASFGGASLLDNLSAYMNPYTTNVVDTTLAGFDSNAGRTRAQQALDMAGAGAFGGSGSALTRSMTEQGLAQQRAATEAGLRSDAFNVGAGLSSSDAERRQSAAAANAAAANQFAMQQAALTQSNNQFNAGAQNTASQFNTGLQDNALSRLLSGAGLAGSLASDMGGSARADTALQGQIGNDLWNVSQTGAQSPLDLLKLQAGLTNSMPYNLFNGQTTNTNSTTKTSDPMGALGSLALLAAAPLTGGASLLGGLGGLGAGIAGAAGGAAAAGAVPTAASLGIFSDLRLKRNVETVGYDPKGRRIVDFQYIWSPQVYRGHIAQELLQSDPHAVIQDESGFLKVNYGALN